ncbi:fluoride efflux transporter CrcB [Psychrobacillus vulpis]|uniref:Fluoride-specific ion channel FluC n=1 Tax=Psychrobacillus vulpis TaxID=2325572 RepID=A0A544TLW2_9BACI|nr:fluoride efflux transporter CrcB [Psychrobacillus vulpis]TQR18451.1 fluoride efflux transporter CrcB [Psychrobacillus vulpis]
MVYLYVGLAGTLGALTRYLLGIIFFSNSGFPLDILTVNLVGCYILAFLTSRVFHKSNLTTNVKTAISTGFLGSFTTFSAFSVETVELFQQGEVLLSVLYVAISSVGGIIMSNLGWKNEVRK